MNFKRGWSHNYVYKAAGDHDPPGPARSRKLADSGVFC